jgi:hypothetical protein
MATASHLREKIQVPDAHVADAIMVSASSWAGSASSLLPKGALGMAIAA